MHVRTRTRTRKSLDIGQINEPFRLNQFRTVWLKSEQAELRRPRNRLVSPGYRGVHMHSAAPDDDGPPSANPSLERFILIRRRITPATVLVPGVRICALVSRHPPHNLVFDFSMYPPAPCEDYNALCPLEFVGHNA
ncbi:hypothetical protein CPAR01_07036 [Colletotrichum paranaense]|uniref:Uncharacterized protein n=1 Tax=Colletotrichum paranaense TaxID=1914294 RepID=A0ABQ9SNG9_9PEZI|nr:uncharacterized protein CPAR01_07036 [Colletotrichum paranaense]KAK1541047.1 hypothetical protein CPAR01_07036 [Colletotrichum paranaense]